MNMSRTLILSGTALIALPLIRETILLIMVGRILTSAGEGRGQFTAGPEGYIWFAGIAGAVMILIGAMAGAKENPRKREI